MTETRDRDTQQPRGRTASATAQQNGDGRRPQQRADAWLAGFESALRSRDIDVARCNSRSYIARPEARLWTVCYRRDGGDCP